MTNSVALFFLDRFQNTQGGLMKRKKVIKKKKKKLIPKKLKFFSLKQASLLTGISTATIQRWDRAGKVVAYKDHFGRRWFDSRLVSKLFQMRYGGCSHEKAFYFRRSKKI